jgi:uncharacterized protein
MSPFTPTSRTRVLRHPERAVYDRELVYSILDEGYICHVGFVAGGQPFVIPTAYGRAGDRIYIHGSAASRMLRSLTGGIDVCVTVTLVDGLVVARAAFRNSINYRSVVILGKARLVTEPGEKEQALRCLTNHVQPGRWEQVRPPTEKEMLATSALVLPLEEVSAKVRSGPPLDAEEDYALPVWAGILPLRTTLGEPIAEAHVSPETPPIDRSRFQRFAQGSR